MFIHTYLKSTNCSTLEAQISLEILGDFSHQALEGQLADKQLSGLLITTNLPQSDGSWPGKHNDIKYPANIVKFKSMTRRY